MENENNNNILLDEINELQQEVNNLKKSNLKKKIIIEELEDLIESN